MEVVQLAVKYLNHMNEVARDEKESSHTNSPAVHVCDFMKLSEEDRMKEFNRGFNESINQTVQYLTKHLGVKSGSTLVVKLVNHLLANLESINACANVSDEHLTSGERLHSNERLSSERLEIDIALTPVESAQLLSSPPPMNPDAVLTSPVIKREVSTQTPSFQASKPSVSVPSVSFSQVSDGKQTLSVTKNHSSNQTLTFHQSNQTPTSDQHTETSINHSMGTRIRDSSRETPINYESPEMLIMNKDFKPLRFWRVREEQTPNLNREKQTPISTETQLSVASESNVDKKRKLSLPSLINQNQSTNETEVDENLISEKLINETPISKKASLSSSESLSPLSSASSCQSVSPSIDVILNGTGSEVKDKITSNVCETLNEGVSSHEKVSKCLAFKKSITLRYQTQVHEETPTSNGEVAPPRRMQTPKEVQPLQASNESVQTLKKLASMENHISIPSIKSPSTEHAQSSTLRTLLSDHSSSNLAPNHSQPSQTQSHQISIHRDASLPKHFSNSTLTHAHHAIYHRNQEVTQSMINSSTTKLRSDPLIVQSKNDSLIVKSRNDPSSRSAPISVINDAMKRRGWEYSPLMSNYQRPCCPHADQVAPPHHLISTVRHPFLGVRSHPYPMPPHPYYHRQAPFLVLEANQNKLISSNQQMNLNQLMSMRTTYQPFHHTHLSKAKTLESKYLNQSNQRL